MPLARKLVVDQTHSDDVLNRKNSLFSICIVVHKGQHSHIGRHVRAEHSKVVVVQVMSKEGMSEHHLGHSDGTAPSNVVI